jgi:hypothetical protein
VDSDINQSTAIYIVCIAAWLNFVVQIVFNKLMIKAGYKSPPKLDIEIDEDLPNFWFSLTPQHHRDFLFNQ